MIVIGDKVSTAMKIVQNKVIEKFGDEISRLVLFGSHARGTARENSDIDILILAKNLICDFLIIDVLSEISEEMLVDGFDVHLCFEKEEFYNLGCEDYYKNVPKYGFTYYSRNYGKIF